MTPGARLAAAAEILGEILSRRAAADRAISAWGKAHRFAGSKDRAAIGERVYTVLRRFNECALAMRSDDPRSLVIGSLGVADGMDVDGIAAICLDGAHALGALGAGEMSALQAHYRSDEPWIVHNYPEWLHARLLDAFGPGLAAEMQALNIRAPLDLRVNSLKAEREFVVEELVRDGLDPQASARTANGIRLATGTDAKVTRLSCYAEGRVEVQDESSQIAVDLAMALPGQCVVDLAAGGGGKTLALAAAMRNRGRIFACDVDTLRLNRMTPRLVRAGVVMCEFAGDPYTDEIAERVGAGADLVFVDAPCSGSGTWRRNPETKWTLTPQRLSDYLGAQKSLLERAAQLTNPGGRIVYAVCSLLPEEGSLQIGSFCERRPEWRCKIQRRLTPLGDGTDGFFVAVLERSAP